MKKGTRNRKGNSEQEPEQEQEDHGITWGNGDVSNCSDDDDDEASSGEASQHQNEHWSQHSYSYDDHQQHRKMKVLEQILNLPTTVKKKQQPSRIQLLVKKPNSNGKTITYQVE